MESVFKKEFESLGGKILISENFGQGDTDFKTQLTKIINVKPEAIYLVGYPKEISLILKQAAELKINSKIIGTVTFEDPNIIKLAANATEGVLYPYPVEADKSDTTVSKFLSAYKAKYSKEPGITCDVGYDAVHMIAEAIKLSNGVKGEDIQKGLMMIKDFRGASGVMAFDKNGDVNKPIEMKIIKKGIFTWLKDVK